MLNFELFVALRRHLDLIADSVIDLRLALRGASDDLISEKSLVNDPVEGTGGSEELIINVRVLGRINTDKVASLLILGAGLPHELSVSQCDSLAHPLMNGCHVVLGILGDVSFDHLQQVSARGLGHHFGSAHSSL
jgi:hypothetical protein